LKSQKLNDSFVIDVETVDSPVPLHTNPKLVITNPQLLSKNKHERTISIMDRINQLGMEEISLEDQPQSNTFFENQYTETIEKK
jgi:hypothetical protein